MIAENRSLTVENLSRYEVRVYLYHRHDPFCKVPLPFSAVSVPSGEYKLCARTSRKFRLSRGGEGWTEPRVFNSDRDVWWVVEDSDYGKMVNLKLKENMERTGPSNLKKRSSEPLNNGHGFNLALANNLTYNLALANNLMTNELQRVFQGRQAHSLLVKNQSHDDIKIYFYGRFNITMHKVCSESIIVKPTETRLKTTSMEFEVYRNVEKNENKLTEPKHLEYDTLCEVNEDRVTFTRIKDGTVSKNELQLQEEKMKFETQVTSNGIENFYKVLGLNMEEERKKSYEDQTRAMKKAYLKLSLEMHPDRNQDNVDYNREIWNMMLDAYEQLTDVEKRVEYHNKYDFQQPYYSKAFWRSLFWSEVYCENEDKILWERIKLCIKRIAFFAGSLGMIGGGLALASSAAWPVVLTAFTLLSGGILSGRSSLQLETTIKQYLQSMALGCAAGFVTGGVVAGASVGILGGVGAAVAAKAGIGAQIGLGTLTAATSGLTASLATDADRHLNGEEVKLCEALTGAVISAIVSAPIGAAGSAIAAGTHFHISKILADTNLDDAALAMFLRRASLHLYSKSLPIVGENLAKLAVQIPLSFIQDRLDKSSEGKGLLEHVVENAKIAGTDAVIDTVGAAAGGIVESGRHVKNPTPHEEFIGVLKNNNVTKRRGISAARNDNKSARQDANSNSWLGEEDKSWLQSGEHAVSYPRSHETLIGEPTKNSNVTKLREVLFARANNSQVREDMGSSWLGEEDQSWL